MPLPESGFGVKEDGRFLNSPARYPSVSCFGGLYD